MGRALIYLWLAVIGVSAIAVPTFMVLDPPTAAIAQLHLASIETSATAACKCARTKQDSGGKAACWLPFEKATGIVHDGSGGTFCYPLSTNYATIDDRMYAALDYSIVADGGNGGEFCTREEAMHAEALYYRELKNARSDAEQSAAEERGVEAMRAYAERLVRGEQVAALERGHGCVSRRSD